MRRYLYAIGIVMFTIFGITCFAYALVTCPAGSHTFSGGDQASGYDMCIPDVGASGPVSGSKSSTTFTPSTKGTVTPSGDTSQTQSQGIAIDTQVYNEVNRLYGTSIYSQAKALYDNSVAVNTSDFNSVVNQVKGLSDAAADPLKRAYNVRAIERLNQVWSEMMALETTYAQQQQQVVTPPATTPTTISPTQITPTSINPTTINPTTISPTDISPTPINPTTIVPQSYGASDLAPGQTIVAPTDIPAHIIKSGQSIYMQAGSAIKYINQNTWQTINGTFRFLEKVAIDGRYKVRTNGGAVVAVRGTQFTINETSNSTTLTLLKGKVTVTSAKGKAVTMKEGYQLTITNGVVGKPTKFDANTLDTWYENVAPGQAFLDSSWTLETAANRYRREVVFKAGSATPTEVLTADEQKTVDAINQGLAIYYKKTVDTIIEKDKRVFSTVGRINANGTASAQLYIGAKGVYYPSGKAGTWKTFYDKAIVSGIFKMVRQENLTYGFDKSTFVFSNWEGTGKNRLAVYTGKLNSAGTADIVNSIASIDPEAGQEIGTAKIYIDEESRLWTKMEAVIMMKSGKIVIPIQMIVSVKYGDAIKVTMPTKLKRMDAKTGLAEMQSVIKEVK